jgi:hypothetical protein
VRAWRPATFSSLRGILETLYGLLVDDGQLAIGAIVALFVTWLVANVIGDGSHEILGWLLLAMVLLLIVANLYRAGRNARSRAG